MNIQTFIFLHDQKIVLDFIKSKKFEKLNNLKFVFLGKDDVSLIKDLDNVIVARDQKINIEEYPKLTSFTGWYAIWKNGLYDADYLNLFEYDINLSDNFNENLLQNLKQSDILGYVPLDIFNPAFIGSNIYSDILTQSINKNYNVDPLFFIKNKYSENFDITVTSNHTFSKKMFEDYMKWVEPLIDDIKYSPMSGHQIERSIPLFYILNGYNFRYVNNLLTHYQLDSHKTQGIHYRFNEYYDKIIKN